jgi:chromosome partitioning protein
VELPVPVLTIASSKGGPGKTTVAMLLAGRLAADGLKVVALDADPTMAFSRWAQNAYEGAPFASRAETDEAQLAHLIETVRLVEGLARAARRDIPALVLLNRVKRTQLARHAAREIERATLPLLAVTLGDLVAYGEMTFSGRVPDQGAAGEELTRLIAELQALGWIPERQTVLT